MILLLVLIHLHAEIKAEAKRCRKKQCSLAVDTPILRIRIPKANLSFRSETLIFLARAALFSLNTLVFFRSSRSLSFLTTFGLYSQGPIVFIHSKSDSTCSSHLFSSGCWSYSLSLIGSSDSQQSLFCICCTIGPS